MTLDPATCYRALSARDARFDGLFFVGVTTTGIYCRPVCAARTPRRDRCRLFGSAAAAERDGFRACFRCRPELAPGLAPLDAVPRLAERAARRIVAGALDEGSVAALAASLGTSARHLQRALADRYGVTPVEWAQTQRLALAKRLLHDSRLGLAEVALAAGFGSVRRFNSAFRERFGRPPSAVRREVREGAARDGSAVRLRLAYRPPLAWDALLAFLGGRAIPGVEVVAGGEYRRTARIGAATGWLAVRPGERGDHLVAEVSGGLVRALAPLVARLRHLFDLDARPAEVDAHLSRDRLLRTRVRRRPGLRVPGAFDGFEAAVRAVLGQQVTVKGATTLAGRLVSRLGEPLATPLPGLTHLFPPPAVLAGAGEPTVARLGMPAARAAALVGLARAADGPAGLRLEPGAPLEETLDRLRALPGIGEWTAQYVALRALGWPDAFPATDLGVKKALRIDGASRVIARAERWRPWRAYATLQLWTG